MKKLTTLLIGAFLTLSANAAIIPPGGGGLTWLTISNLSYNIAVNIAGTGGISSVTATQIANAKIADSNGNWIATSLGAGNRLTLSSPVQATPPMTINASSNQTALRIIPAPGPGVGGAVGTNILEIYDTNGAVALAIRLSGGATDGYHIYSPAGYRIGFSDSNDFGITSFSILNDAAGSKMVLVGRIGTDQLSSDHLPIFHGAAGALVVSNTSSAATRFPDLRLNSINSASWLGRLGFYHSNVLWRWVNGWTNSFVFGSSSGTWLRESNGAAFFDSGSVNIRTQLNLGAVGEAGSLWAYDDQGNPPYRVVQVFNRDMNIGSTNGQDNLVFWAKELTVDNPIRMNFDGWDFTGPHLLFYKLAARAPTGWSEQLVDVKSTNGLQFFLVDSNGNVGVRTNAPQSALHINGDLTVNGGLSVTTFITDLLIVLSNVVEFTASANHQLDHNGPLRWNGSNSLAQHTALSFTNIYKTTNSHGSITLEGPASGGPYNVTNLLGGAIGSVPTLFATNGGPYATSVIVSVADNTVLEENWNVRFSRGTNFVDILYTVLTR